jgi:hypothetical protein
MRSIRKFAYAVVLSLSIFAVQPTLAAAEDAHGSFTLPHEIRCQKVVLRPGDCVFSVKTMSSSEFLALQALNSGTNARLLVNDVEKSKPDEVSKLVLASRDGQSFVSSLELPELDMSLHFAVPTQNALKQGSDCDRPTSDCRLFGSRSDRNLLPVSYSGTGCMSLRS